MKRLWVILIIILLLLTLFGCAEQETETVYEVNSYGIDLQVDTAQKTISDGRNTYHYEFSGDSDSYRATITYPDGSTYW